MPEKAFDGGAGQAGSAKDQLINLQSPEPAPYWNKGAERIFGYTADEVIGKPIIILIPPEGRISRANYDKRDRPIRFASRTVVAVDGPNTPTGGLCCKKDCW
ncbi:MAG TPA: PAS domain S-box protein [Pyrinomonadaceae bacterium]|jgi:PAS domain S-box-containing protein